MGHVQGKEGEIEKEPGEAALGCGELAGLLRGSGFLLRALGASEGLPWGKVHTDLCPLRFFSILIQPPRLHPARSWDNSLQSGVVQGRDAGDQDAGCGSADGEEGMS